VNLLAGPAKASALETTINQAVDRLRCWLPQGFEVVAAPCRLDWPIPAGERDCVRAAVDTRRADFITGRWCARQALQRLGLSPLELPIGVRGAPQWPGGVVGSISHDQGYCVAAVGHCAEFQNMGLDWFARGNANKLLSMASLVLSDEPGERLLLVDNAAQHLPRLFCTKEAVVKAVSGAAGRYLDMQDIRVRSSGESFIACIASPQMSVHGWCSDLPGGIISLAIYK
jgi:4'-phosphopantetheinyl transferase EntD